MHTAIPGCDLLGHWPLRDDARDHSGRGHHGVSHGTPHVGGRFDGRTSYVDIPSTAALNLGRDSFTIAAWVKADDASAGLIGDVVGKWDAETRRGFTLCIKGTAGGYNTHGSERHIHFGIDDAQLGAWEDCGRPNPTSNYVSNSLTVFHGDLYAATTDAATPRDWAHVYRYEGGQSWQDCGRVGELKTRGVGPLLVHDAQLYAATWSYDWVRVEQDDLDCCRVYRYEGPGRWVDCGQPGRCRRLFSLASFARRLYVAGDDDQLHVYQGDQQWTPVRKFRGFVHPMAVHHGRLYVGEFGRDGQATFRPAEVHSYDGRTWTSAGQPLAHDREDQLHALHVHEGQLHVTTWPHGKVAALDADGRWIDRGRLGQSTESNALHVHNGKLYAGTIPHAEVYRYDGPDQWQRVARFAPPAAGPDITQTDLDHWGRVTSLTAYAGRLFASVGSYTSSVLDAPADVRGRVFATRAGACASWHHDIASRWRHITAVRHPDRLELYLDHTPVAEARLNDAPSDLTNTAPLRIGLGAVDFFSGRIRDLRLWRGTPTPNHIPHLPTNPPT